MRRARFNCRHLPGTVVMRRRGFRGQCIYLRLDIAARQAYYITYREGKVRHPMFADRHAGHTIEILQSRGWELFEPRDILVPEGL